MDQASPTSETKWLCIGIDDYKIVNIYKFPISEYSHIAVSMLMTVIASMLIGVMMLTVQMENPWLAGQLPTVLHYFITQRMPPTSALAAGIQVPT